MANAELKVVLSADGKQLASTMQQAETSVQALSTELKKTSPALDTVDKSLSKTSASLKKAAQSASQAKNNFEKIAPSTTGTTDALNKFQNTLDSLDFSGKLAEAQARIDASIDKMAASALEGSEALEKLGNEATEAVPKLSRLQSVVSRFGGGVKSFSSAQFELVSGINLSNKALAKVPAGSNRAAESLLNLGRIAQDAPFGFLGIANNINPLLESFQRLKKETGSTKSALKSLASGLGGAGGLGLAISVLSSLLVVFGDKIFKAKKEVNAAEEANKKYKESVENIFQNAGKEASEVLSLIAVLKNETETRERKLAAIKELQRIQPEVFEGLKLEGNAVTGLDALYKDYIKNLKTVIAVKIKQTQLENLLTQQLERQGATQTAVEKKLLNLDKFRNYTDSLANSFVAPEDASTQFFKGLAKKSNKATQELNQNIDGILKDLEELSKGIDVKIDAKPKGDIDKFYDELIKRAKAAENYINNRTIRFANFEIDPTDSKKETIKKAEQFIKDVFGDLTKAGGEAKSNRGRFIIKTVAEAEVEVLKSSKYFEGLKKEAAGLLKDIQSEISNLIKRNPILIEFERVKAEQKARGAELADSLGLRIEGINAAKSLLTNTQKAAVNAANTINGILVPAFGSLFDAIQKGENPIRAFFQSIGQAVTQLIQKLIQAAIQAAIISAIFPGLTNQAGGFGGLLKSILGFRAEGGPVFANRPYIVGEQGPELFIPKGGGQIIPNNQMNSGLAGVSAGMQTVKVVGQISGRDIRLISARQSGYENRNV